MYNYIPLFVKFQNLSNFYTNTLHRTSQWDNNISHVNVMVYSFPAEWVWENGVGILVADCREGMKKIPLVRT